LSSCSRLLNSPRYTDGSRAGAYLAFLAAAHSGKLLPTAPIAILSYYGVPTFTSPFFASSHVIYESLKKSQVSHFLEEAVSTGITGPEDAFDISCLLDNGSPNPAYTKPKATREEEQPLQRGMLYDYLVQENLYPSILGNVGIDFKGEIWDTTLENTMPKVVMVHGDKDIDVPIDLEREVISVLRENRARLVIVKRAGHNFDDGLYWDDKGLEGVREAWRLLDGIIENGSFIN
jgi:pimeloyl-ACP methyl ester carboxylesterase